MPHFGRLVLETAVLLLDSWKFRTDGCATTHQRAPLM